MDQLLDFKRYGYVHPRIGDYILDSTGKELGEYLEIQCNRLDQRQQDAEINTDTNTYDDYKEIINEYVNYYD
jgi:hypothetical protein